MTSVRQPAAAVAVRPGADPVARLAVWSAVAALVLVLAATAARYGYHRDELYFRMLEPAWGYPDQPPFTPLLVHGISLVVDEVWAIRVPAIVFAALSVLVVAAITREAGGGRLAQAFSAWGYAFGAGTIVIGHSMFTATVDLLVWPLVSLLVLKALRTPAPRWWLLAGAVAGLSTYNKLLIAMLLVALGIGVLAARPWHPVTLRWAPVGALVMLALTAPNLVYQALHGWPQLDMGAALSASNGAAVRPAVLPFLVVLIGPPLVPIWVAGLVACWRRPAWRSFRAFGVAFPVLVALVIAAGAQFYYAYGLLAVMFALGCVPAAEWVVRTGRVHAGVLAIAGNSLVSVIIGLPVIPVGLVSATPIAAMNQGIRDQLGWETYARQVDAIPAAHGPDAVVLTQNFGEAGAIDRYAPALRDRIHSGHNGLGERPGPPAATRTVVAVGYGLGWIERRFESCEVVTRLESGLGVPSQEQGAPVRVCTDPVVPIADIWKDAKRLG